LDLLAIVRQRTDLIEVMIAAEAGRAIAAEKIEKQPILNLARLSGKRIPTSPVPLRDERPGF
jgi:hypothetical protein